MINYSDGWMRVFNNAEIPTFNDAEKKLLTDYKNSSKFDEILIYLEYYRQITGDMAEFLLREICRGVLDAEQIPQ